MPSKRRETQQVNFRIGGHDCHLLDMAAEEHGSITGGIIAGLRALEQQRLDDAAPDPPAAPHERTAPASPGEGEFDWHVPIADAAPVLRVSEKVLRSWIPKGWAQARGRGKSLEVDVPTVRLSRVEAARWLDRTSATVKRWTEDGKIHADDAGRYVLGELEIPIAEAEARWEFTAEELAELTGREHDTPRGPMVRVLDAIELSGSPEREGEESGA